MERYRTDGHATFANEVPVPMQTQRYGTARNGKERFGTPKPYKNNRSPSVRGALIIPYNISAESSGPQALKIPHGRTSKSTLTRARGHPPHIGRAIGRQKSAITQHILVFDDFIWRQQDTRSAPGCRQSTTRKVPPMKPGLGWPTNAVLRPRLRNRRIYSAQALEFSTTTTTTAATRERLRHRRPPPITTVTTVIITLG